MSRIFLKYSLLATAIAWCAGCTDGGGEIDVARCQGRLAIMGTTSAEVVSRAEVDLAGICAGLKVPEPAELRLTLTGKDIAELEATETGELVPVGQFDYTGEWPALADYDQPDLYPGTYTATLEYGDPTAVGPDAPYYKGEVQAEVAVAEVRICRVGVTIRNAAVRVTATEQFAAYFSDARFVLEVDDAETPYGFTLGDADRPVFVPAGAKIVLKGSVRRPSQTSADDADGELFEIKVPARTTAAGTLYTFVLAVEAGGATVEVVFLEPEAGGEEDEELNDDAISDVE